MYSESSGETGGAAIERGEPHGARHACRTNNRCDIPWVCTSTCAGLMCNTGSLGWGRTSREGCPQHARHQLTQARQHPCTAYRPAHQQESKDDCRIEEWHRLWPLPTACAPSTSTGLVESLHSTQAGKQHVCKIEEWHRLRPLSTACALLPSTGTPASLHKHTSRHSNKTQMTL
jgi:hypothetical protein